MASKININLDTSKENYLVAKCKQNDDLTLEASIFENGLALDLTNKTITIQALKSDNTYIIQNTDIVKENNKINAELDRDFSRVPGTTKIEIVLVESSKQNTTFSFYLEVVGSVIRGAVQSSNTATILEALDNKIVEAGVVKEETEQLIESGGAAKKEDIININASLEQNVKNISSNLFNSKPTVLMHRGFVGLAPENTMLAIEYADKYGCRGVEIDIRMTKDKVMILHHDATVDRMTNGTGDVNSFNLQEIQTLNIDSGTNIGKVGALKIPTLDEILNYIRNTKMVVMLHIYDIDENNIINLVNMLKKYSILERTIISSTNINYLNSFRNIDKSLQLSFITTLVNDSTVNTALSLGNCYLALTLKGYTAEDINYCHSLGIKIVGDTLNTFTDYKRILKNNIDIILSDIYIKREV